MPKILFVADSLVIGGAERQLTLLVKYLPTPWTSRVVSFGDGMFAPKIVELGVDLTILERRVRFDLKPIFNFWKLLRAFKPDIVHSWGWMSSAIAAPLCKMLDIRFINGCIRNGNALTRKILRARMAFYLSDCIVANSFAGLEACGISNSNGKVIYNAMDPQRLIHLNRSKRRKPSPFTVVMAARMDPAKNFIMFINGARRINKIEPGNWKFIALGDGIERKYLIENSGDLISDGVMEYPDVIDEVIPYLLQADIGVLLSNGKLHNEGFSNAIMEYMACELPVICMDNGGNKELVIPNETGLLLESDNVQDLVEKLLWLAQHPEEARQMGNAGRERIKQLCSIERMVREFINVYEDVLNLKSSVTRDDRQNIF